MAFMVGNAEVVAGARQAQDLPRLRHVPADPDRGDRHAQRGLRTTRSEVNAIYQSRRDALCDGLDRIGWEIPPPKGTMFVWAPIPEPYREMGSVEFASVARAGGRSGHVSGRRLRPRRRRHSCASRSSRTSSASARPCATSARPCPSSDRGGAVRRPGARSTDCGAKRPESAEAERTTTREKQSVHRDSVG